MAVVRKKRLKLKKKNFAIFLFCIFLIITSLNWGIKSITKTLNKSNQKKETIVKKEKPVKKKVDSFEEEYKKVGYYKEENLERYKKYKTKYPNLTTEQVITNINIGLDNKYYTNTKEAKHLNKSYILVNKYNYLEKNYVPDNLEKISTQYALAGMRLISYAKNAFENMAKSAQKENLSIIAMSSYRSYEYQTNLYNSYVKSDGKEKADTYSGRPGFSEHQTGLAVDVYNGKENYTNFGNTKEFEWMKKNAYKYGFILRYPKGKELETGYEYETWHYRYVGKEIAKYIYENNISYEEYYIKNFK